MGARRAPDCRELVDRNQRVVARRREGKTLREISAECGLSIVRVHQILTRETRRLSDAAHTFSSKIT